jgi:PilZ domain
LQIGEEKRNAPRFPWVAEIAAVICSELGVPDQTALVLRGFTIDIAKDGIGVASDRLLRPGVVLRCEIGIPDTAIRIPTLLRVRWSNESTVKRQYRLGLQFLL